tara:strand:- start:231 stop:1370 length:1140 start_codon:yes stop_codon:yes gene_type:complete
MNNNWIITGATTQIESVYGGYDIAIGDGLICETVTPTMRPFNGSGLIAMPGIIDLHGDGFERHIAPRNGVEFDLETALLATDRELISNGITTAYLAMTISWEPGLRSLKRAREIVSALKKIQSRCASELRLQLRWEIFALEALADVESWLDLDLAPTLAFNDHLSAILTGMKPHILSKNAGRCGLSMEEYVACLKDLESRADEIPAAVSHLADLAKNKGITCFAHDEGSPDERVANRSMGISVCEFPITNATARAAVNAGEATVLGAPNVLRGKSHTGAIDATDAIAKNFCSVLASDYYYSSQLAAVAKLGDKDPSVMATFWPHISGNAANAVELADRGQIVPGKLADLVLYRIVGGHPQIVAVFCKGYCRHLLDTTRI